ncbi:SRPBCC family protein [Micromonospora peucetia]|uniref:SRPBCC family protein n=1 Tax=Micromonospora peucetia TaxID=47871 RepID=UPI00332D8A02
MEFIAEPDRQSIVIRRFFDAPRHLVFKACTEPDLLARWWGSSGFENSVDRMEVRPGGTYRYVSRDGGGTEFAIGGVYHDVAAPERIVQTFQFEGMPGQVQLETITFEEAEGGTRYEAVCIFQSVRQRDDAVLYGMEVETRSSMDRLAQVVASLR